MYVARQHVTEPLACYVQHTVLKDETQKCVSHLLCVISAIVQINSLVKSGESTYILVA
jgi:predicted anti-sigma-YlaC factor YlaD